MHTYNKPSNLINYLQYVFFLKKNLSLWEMPDQARQDTLGGHIGKMLVRKTETSLAQRPHEPKESILPGAPCRGEK